MIKGTHHEDISDFDNATKLKEKDIMIGSLNRINVSQEKWALIFNHTVFANPQHQYYVMAKVVNRGNVSGPVSNVVLVSPKKEASTNLYSRMCIMSGAIIFVLVMFGCISYFSTKTKSSAYSVKQSTA